MNAGKSTMLIKNAYNYTEQGLHIVTMKPSVDTKGDRLIVARDGGEWGVDVLATPAMDLEQEVESFLARQAFEMLNCVLVDEAQFLEPIQIDQLHRVAKIGGISVIAYGLKTDFQTKLFPASQRLLELADNIDNIQTMCRCGSQAHFNCRKLNGKYVFIGEQVAIDGQDGFSYDSLCGTCYLNEKAAA